MGWRPTGSALRTGLQWPRVTVGSPARQAPAHPTAQVAVRAVVLVVVQTAAQTPGPSARQPPTEPAPVMRAECLPMASVA